MKAMITGASSGIGRSMALYLGSLGYDLILVARNKEAMDSLREKIKTKVKVIVVDLANEQKVKELYVLTKNEEVDLLINNAGFEIAVTRGDNVKWSQENPHVPQYDDKIVDINGILGF